MAPFNLFGGLWMLALCSSADAVILRLPCLVLADFSIIKHNNRLKGHVIQKHFDVNDVSCAEKCVENPRCRSYNAFVELKICELNDRVFGDFGANSLTYSPGWIYKSTDYTITNVGDTCNRLRPCGSGVMCKEKCKPPFYECITCSHGYSGLHCDRHDAIDGGWGSWEPFSQCSRICAGGFRRRVRKCHSPKPAFGGSDCVGSAEETSQCGLEPCPDFNACAFSTANGTTECLHLTCLVDDEIRCEGNNKALQHFRLLRIDCGDTMCNTYRVKCCELAARNMTVTITKSTTKVDYIDDTRALARLSAIDCDEHGFLMNMKLQLTESGTKVHYDYQCASVTHHQWRQRIVCYDQKTGWQANGNGHLAYLDRLAVICAHQGYVLNKLKMNLSRKKTQWQYEFRCCRIESF